MRVDYGAATHAGAVRPGNEDSVAVSADLFVVADGMGGHAAGEVASRLVVERLSRPAGSRPLTSQIVRDLVAQANDDILGSVAEHAEQAGMGTTLAGVAIVVADGMEQWVAFNVGDSRVYRFDGRALTQVSTDHSIVAELMLAGQLTSEQARVHPRRNVVTRSLGSDPAPLADLWLLPPAPGDRFLICSDGLPLEVEDGLIEQTLAEQSDPQAAADRLVELAVTAGGRDNVSAVVVDLVAP